MNMRGVKTVVPLSLSGGVRARKADGGQGELRLL